MYYEGVGIAKNIYRAFEIERKGCDMDPIFCLIQGDKYRIGPHRLQDYMKASLLYQSGCDAMWGGACFELAEMYYKGQGLRQSKIDALKYYGRACDLKSQAACDVYAKLNTSK